MTRFIVVPQWQGSPSARAMNLVDGAEAIHGDLPRAHTVRIDVPLEAGDAGDSGVRRLSTLVQTRELLEQELSAASERAIVIGGDCGVALGAIAHAARRAPDLAVVWCDAHPDFHTPESSPSGAFGGMVLRAVTGTGASALTVADGAVTPSRVVLVGARGPEPEETEALLDARVHQVGTLDPDAVAAAVGATGASAVYVHVDVDVLDPSAITGVQQAVPFGPDVAELVAAIGAVRDRAELVGASVAGFAPSSPDAAVQDMGAILRIIGALA